MTARATSNQAEAALPGYARSAAYMKKVRRPIRTFLIFIDFCFNLVGTIVEICKITWHSDKIIGIMKAVFEDSCSIAKKLMKN